MMKPSAFILSLFAMFSTSVLAQDLRVCPNVQVGEAVDPPAIYPAIYSDCTIQNNGGGPALHVTLLNTSGAVIPNAIPPANFDPTPTGDVPLGTEFDGLDLVAEDMGPNYTGTCSDMAASIPTFDLANTTPFAVDGNVYCGRISNTEGNQVWLRGTADVAGNTWKDPIVLTNQPGVGTPYSPISPGVLWFITRGTQVDEEE